MNPNPTRIARYAAFVLPALLCGIVIKVMVTGVYAQSDSVIYQEYIPDLWMDRMEDVLEDDTEDITEISDDWILPSESPYNLNILEAHEAVYILGLTEYQYYQLQSYIANYGELVSVYELAAIDGYTDQDLKRLYPYITVSSTIKKMKWKDIFRYPKQELLLRYERILEEKAGYDTSRSSHYFGSPFRLCFRYKYTTAHLIFGIAGEKDAGEEFLSGSQKQGFDHYSFHLQLKNMGLLKNLVVGDYRLDFGQGLVLGGGFLNGRGNGAGGIRKFPVGVRSVLSMNEGNQLHGFAATLGNFKYQGTLFYGFRHYDGDQWEDEATGARFFEGALAVKGYHRTVNEIAKKHALTQHVYGFDLFYRNEILKVGLRGLGSNFSAFVVPHEDLYRLFDFTGKGFYNFSADYQLLIKKTILFGEVAIGREAETGILQGLIWQTDPMLKLSLLFRHYAPGFIALMGNSFGRNSKNQNETGLYVAADLVPGKKVEVQYYMDFYYFPWLRYRVDRPSRGMDMSLKNRIQLSSKANLEIRYQFKIKERNSHDMPHYNEIGRLNTHRFRFNFQFNPLPSCKLKTEVDFLYNKIPGISGMNKGFLLFQDLTITWTRMNLDFKCRIALFETDSYEEKIYAYEQDLYRVFNITAYHDRGWRGYLIIKYRYKWLDLSLKISQTHYFNKMQISSGLECIDGNEKTEIKLQSLFRF